MVPLLSTAVCPDDLNLLKLLVLIGPSSAKGALTKLRCQLWYLNKMLAFASFDRDADVSEERAMVEALRCVGEEDPPRDP